MFVIKIANADLYIVSYGVEDLRVKFGPLEQAHQFKDREEAEKIVNSLAKITFFEILEIPS